MSAINDRIEEIDSILKSIPERKNMIGFRYPVSEKLDQQIERNFRYHPSKEGQEERYIAIRDKARAFAHAITAMTPESREQATALADLESCVMWANAAIARNETAPIQREEAPLGERIGRAIDEGVDHAMRQIGI